MKVLTGTDELAAAVDRLSGADVVTVDTEFMRETTYWPRLCVIQLASPDETVIVDAMAVGIDLSPFYALMANERVLKVFHAARQDIEIVFHQAGRIPHPIFDTQVAAMVCGFGDSISYEQLVQRLTGEQIDKSSRFTDWSRRPLSDRQVAYAAADVTHLRAVHRALAARLDAQGRSDWVASEMEVLTSVDTYRLDPEIAWKRLKIKARRPIEMAVLMEIAAWREREAQSRDVPRGRVLKDETLQEIAMQQPGTPDELAQLRTIPRGFERSRQAEEILAAVKRAADLPRDKLPRLPKPKPMGEVNAAAVDLLRVLLKMASETHGVATRLIASSEDIEAIAADDYADVPALEGWRRRLFGETALRLKRGEIALRLDGRRVRLVETGRGQTAEAAE